MRTFFISLFMVFAVYIDQTMQKMFDAHPDDPQYFCISSNKQDAKTQQYVEGKGSCSDPSQGCKEIPKLSDCYQAPVLKEHFWDYHQYHISLGDQYPQLVTAVIEIPKGNRAKFEADYRGFIKLDRILHSSIHYPAHYGFIPQTLCGDRDPLDILVLCSEDVPPMTLIEARVIGAMHMVDSGEADDKILAVANNDPSYDHIQDLNDLPIYIIKEIQNFFEDYKKLEQKVVVVQEDFRNRAQAMDLIMDNILIYKLSAQKSGREAFTKLQQQEIHKRAEHYYHDHEDSNTIYTMDELEEHFKDKKTYKIKQTKEANQPDVGNREQLDNYVKNLKNKKKNQKQKSDDQEDYNEIIDTGKEDQKDQKDQKDKDNQQQDQQEKNEKKK